MGRPTKLTKARADDIVAAARIGAPRHVAAAAAGISRSTLQTWLAKGETVDAPELYRKFAEALREADATCEIRALGHIAKAAQDDWRAAAWYLEHARRDYGKRHEITGAEGGPLEVEGTWNLSELTERELAALQELAAKSGGEVR